MVSLHDLPGDCVECREQDEPGVAEYTCSDCGEGLCKDHAVRLQSGIVCRVCMDERLATA